MASKGIEFHFERNVTAVRQVSDGYAVELDGGETIEADCVMYATGRVPASAGLGLLDAGVEVRANGSIPVDEHSRTNISHIFAMGDITNRINLTPVAIMEGHAFADTEFGDQPR